MARKSEASSAAAGVAVIRERNAAVEDVVPARIEDAMPPRARRVALIVESAVAPRRMMLNGVARYIQEHEPWSVYLKPFGVEPSLGRWLRDWEGDGIIAAVRGQIADILSQRSARKGQRTIPIVDVVGVLRHERVPLVHTNDHAVGRLGAEHLLERGFRNFGFCGYAGEFWSEHRREGFCRALAAKGHACAVYTLPPPGPGSGGPESWEQQQRSLTEWLRALQKPVGIMTTNDLTGQQLLEACQRLRIQVPEAVAVVGVDNDEPICRIASPPLSSVIVNDHQRGYEAAALLDRLMSGDPAPSGPVYIEPVGVATRASTDIMAIEDQALVKGLRFLRDHACERISVDDVAREVPLSRSVLERRFRKTLGRSINAEIVRLRINRAIELLTETELELKVIARRAGFGTQSYMNAVFQAKVGKTPGSFRKALGT